MARSSYVYVVIEDHKPIAGFTVKWELTFWLSKQPLKTREIWRLPDGITKDRPTVDITKEFVPL